MLRTVFLLLAPVAPFSSHYYAKEIYGLDPHRAPFPAPSDFTHKPETTAEIVAFNSLVWKTKQEQGLSLGAPVANISVPAGLKDFETELREMHKLQ